MMYDEHTSPLDDRLESLLVGFDEALARGAAPVANSTSSDPTDPELAVRLQGAQDCLRLLEQAWPRVGTSRTRGGQSSEVPQDSASRTGSKTRGCTPSRRRIRHKEEPFPTVPGYEILSVLGRGGMGVVYKARQLRPRRLVALKMILAEGCTDPDRVARFRAEGEAVARLQHEQIIKVHEVNEWRPQGGQSVVPYFTLEYINGGSLAEQVAGRPQPAKLAAQLVEKLARAMDYAHQQHIIHRDLKPANVLLQLADCGEPVETRTRGSASFSLQSAIPKITDFGLAKQLDSEEGQTSSGTLIGTPSYMAPEQADGRSRDIGPNTDVYALGAILYELLTGRAPFHGDSTLETLRQVREQEPPAPTSLQPKLPRDLETICLKCLRKEPSKRYATAGALADDLGRFLRGEPIQARPVAWLERTAGWCRRNPVVALLTAGIAAALLIGTAVSVGFALNAAQKAEDERQARLEADREKQKAEENEDTTRTVLDFFENRVLAAARPDGQDGGLGHDVKLIDAIRFVEPSLAASFEQQPLIEARLRMTLGKSFSYLGEFAEAQEQYVRARQLFTKHRGRDHRDTLWSMHKLADTYDSLGNHAEALKLRKETLELRESSLGANDPDTLASMNGLAVSYYMIGGKDAEALDLQEKTLALCKHKLGPDHPQTLATMSSLANTYNRLGRDVEALQLRKRILDAYSAKVRPEHPDRLNSMYDLARSYMKAEQYDEALELFEKTLELRKTILSLKHPSTLLSMWGKALCLWKLNRRADAVPVTDEYVRRAKGIQRQWQLIMGLLELRLRHFERAKDAAGCRTTAEMWEEQKLTEGIPMWRAAVMRAVTAAVAKKDPKIPVAEVEEQSNRAMLWLKQLDRARGVSAEQLENQEFDGLRDRDDFKELVLKLKGQK